MPQMMQIGHVMRIDSPKVNMAKKTLTNSIMRAPGTVL